MHIMVKERRNRMIKEYLNIFVRKTIIAMLHVFYLFPVKNNRIIFESFDGRGYSCNPKYISEYLLKNYSSEYEIVWSFINPEKYCKDNIANIYVKKNSIRYMYYRLTSKVIITNMTDPIYIPKRNNQLLICTWHAAGAYKKVGNSFTGNNSKSKEWQMRVLRDKTDTWISSSKMFTETNIVDAYDHKGTILKAGMPRNDIFFNPDRISKASLRVKAKYGIQEEMVILYAPTYKGDRVRITDSNYEFPFFDFLKRLYSETNRKIVFLFRGHYYVNKNDTLFQQDDDYFRFINVSDYPDMQELLCAIDMLITDYSSSMWDNALAAKPCLLWIPDRSEYDHSRGTYTSIDTWPGIPCEDKTALLNAVDEINSFDFKAKAKKHFEEFQSYETGNATVQVVNYIMNYCKTGVK